MYSSSQVGKNHDAMLGDGGTDIPFLPVDKNVLINILGHFTRHN
jgi:hypothetical protein